MRKEIFMGATTAYQRAKRRMEDVEGFSIHLIICVMVLVALTLIDFTTSGGWWSLWVAVIWGFAVGIHALPEFVFVFEGRFTCQWEGRKLREYSERDRARHRSSPL